MPSTEMIEWTASAGRIHANGEVFNIKGANWFGTEGQHAMLYGLEKHGLDYYLEFLAANKFNSLRLRRRRRRRRRRCGCAARGRRGRRTRRRHPRAASRRRRRRRRIRRRRRARRRHRCGSTAARGAGEEGVEFVKTAVPAYREELSSDAARALPGEGEHC